MSRGLDRSRLAKLLGMMGSDHDGEVLAAARAAQKLVKDAGKTWADAVNPEAPAPRVVMVEGAPREADPRQLALDTLQSDYLPDTKEMSFLRDVLARRKALTTAQIRWIKIIAVKAGVL